MGSSPFFCLNILFYQNILWQNIGLGTSSASLEPFPYVQMCINAYKKLAEPLKLHNTSVFHA